MRTHGSAQALRDMTVRDTARVNAFLLPCLMSTYIALLRAINVGGRNRVAMADLRALVTSLGFKDVQSLLQSGNLVLRGPKQATATLERTLERATAAQLSVTCDFMVRTDAEWRAIVAGNPFPEAAARDPGHLVVLCMKGAPTTPQVTALRGAIAGREVIQVSGREAYLVYPDGIGTSKLTNAVLESKLGTRGTGRNWNTVLKLAALAAG